MSSFGTISIFTTRTVRLVKRKHQLFCFCDQSSLWMIQNGPGPHSRTTTLMRLIVLQVDLPLAVPLGSSFPTRNGIVLIDLNAFRMSMIQNLCWTMVVTCSVPRDGSSFVHFARTIQWHDVSNVLVLDALFRSSIDFYLFYLRHEWVLAVQRMVQIEELFVFWFFLLSFERLDLFSNLFLM